MIGSEFLTRLGRDEQGGPTIEFALLFPAIFTLLFGVLQIGLQMYSFNAIRSVASDTARYTMVEYQKDDKLTAGQVESRAIAIAANTPYTLTSADFDATVTTPATDITGMIKFQLDITYTPPNPLKFAGINGLTMTTQKFFYVSAT